MPANSASMPPTDLRASLCAAVGWTARQLPAFRGKSHFGRKICAHLFGGRRKGTVQVILKDGTRFVLDPRGRTESDAFFNGESNTDDIAFLQCCLGDGAVALDIGANIGLIAIPLGRFLRNHHGRLFAFEPVASNGDRLALNVNVNGLDGMVELFRCALGDAEGDVKIGREIGDGSETANALLEQAGKQMNEPLEWSTVPLRRLDAVCVDLQLARLDAIKIDVEGAELAALRGGLGTIQRFRPVIYGEFNAGLMPHFNSTFADIGEVFKPLSYQALAFRARLDLEIVPFEPGRGNAVLCPSEKVDWLLLQCRQARR